MVNVREYFKLIVFRDYWESWHHLGHRNHNAMDRSICLDYMKFQLEKGKSQEDFDELQDFYNKQVACLCYAGDWIQELKNDFASGLNYYEFDGDYDHQQVIREMKEQAEWSVTFYDEFLNEIAEREESIWS